MGSQQNSKPFLACHYAGEGGIVHLQTQAHPKMYRSVVIVLVFSFLIAETFLVVYSAKKVVLIHLYLMFFSINTKREVLIQNQNGACMNAQNVSGHVFAKSQHL